VPNTLALRHRRAMRCWTRCASDRNDDREGDRRHYAVTSNGGGIVGAAATLAGQLATDAAHHP